MARMEGLLRAGAQRLAVWIVPVSPTLLPSSVCWQTRHLNAEGSEGMCHLLQLHTGSLD